MAHVKGKVQGHMNSQLGPMYNEVVRHLVAHREGRPRKLLSARLNISGFNRNAQCEGGADRVDNSLVNGFEYGYHLSFETSRI